MKIKKNGILESNLITQIGFVVKDIERTAKEYAKFFSVEVPKINETAGSEITLAEFKEEKTEARAKLAFFKFKNITLELIEPISGPSTWQNHLDNYGEGVHHIAFQVKNVPEKIEILKKENMQLEQKGNFPGGHYAYIDSRNQLKVMLELLGKGLKKI